MLIKVLNGHIGLLARNSQARVSASFNRRALDQKYLTYDLKRSLALELWAFTGCGKIARRKPSSSGGIGQCDVCCELAFRTEAETSH